MSTCDCDRKSTNGGTCDGDVPNLTGDTVVSNSNSCGEETFVLADKKASTMGFAPVSAMKTVDTVECVSFEGCCSAAQPL